MQKKALSIYIHIPFCKSKCSYCDFNSYAGMEELIPAYFSALKRNLAQYEVDFDKYIIKTVFLGGGTPSIVDADLIYDYIMNLRSSFEFDNEAEISIECNPGTLKPESLGTYKKAGINRISLGLQCWQNELLKKLGRIHTAEDFERTLTYVKDSGFTNFNADLIFGIPGQTMEEWKETLGRVVSLGIPHLSCYSLSIEEGTQFGEMHKRGELPEPDDEIDRDMYHYTVNMLRDKGYKHYEISNFAKPGFECRHNLVYWRCGRYIGLGAGAHSYFNDSRYNNKVGIREYICALSTGRSPAENFETIDTNEQRAEYMIVGLRTEEGIDINDFKNRFGADVMTVYGTEINRLIERGLLVIDSSKISLSETGLDLANQVFVEFI